MVQKRDAILHCRPVTPYSRLNEFYFKNRLVYLYLKREVTH